jgi:hypothetical protein
MKRVIILASLMFLASLCVGQGFDKEMEAAGKKFHKQQSKNSGTASSKKQKRVSTSGAGKTKSKEAKGVSTLDGTKKKKNRAKRKKGHRQRG